MDGTWVHLRECLSCGHVGCCDSSVSYQRRNGVLFRATLSPAGESSLEIAPA
jgi:CPA1 family monovalent cation:H+ antiporter